ncbi:RecQ family zinc-binding domain-containing protein, partial [Nocardia cyriacigeorgica]|uniref:RecQ family zinc-binding domain-containing protein n=1 Tax=Nocardia cyriacigeorgica TaxID=135487 RepID=UPI003CC8083F
MPRFQRPDKAMGGGAQPPEGREGVVELRKLIDASDGVAALRRQLQLHLDAMLALCETVNCRRSQLLAY